jgi:lysophospholipase L1-like esterase
MATTPQPRTGRSKALRWAAAGLGVLVGLASAEGLLRLVWVPPKLTQVGGFGPDPVVLWAPTPGTKGVLASGEYRHAFTHNAQGLRGDRPAQHERPPGKPTRMLFLGDSFTYGLGNENSQTIPAVVEQLWPEAEAINAGCNGYGQAQELAMLDRLGPALRPDVVVLMWYTNDLEDNLNMLDRIDFATDERGRVVRLRPGPEVDRDAPDPLAPRPTVEGTLPQHARVLYLAELWNSATAGIRYRLTPKHSKLLATPADRERAWSTTARLISLIKRRTDELGARLVVLNIPFRNQVEPDTPPVCSEYPLMDVQTNLARICREAGAEFIDALEPLRAAKAAGAPRFYWPIDMHCTPAGSAALAKIVVSALRPDARVKPGEGASVDPGQGAGKAGDEAARSSPPRG